MPGRSGGVGYRYGFNGKENDGETGWQDYGLRLYDPEICRFFSVDPLMYDYPFYTPYQFAGNMPIAFIDLDGGEPATPPAMNQAQKTAPNSTSYTYTYVDPWSSNETTVPMNLAEATALGSVHSKYLTDPYFFMDEVSYGKKWIGYWNSNTANIRGIFKKVSERFNIPVEQLFVVAMGEGLPAWLDKTGGVGEIDGYARLGLDDFGTQHATLVEKEIIKDGEILFTPTNVERDEPGDFGKKKNLVSAIFPSLEHGLMAVGASMVYHRQEAEKYWSGKGVAIANLNADQVFYMTYVYYQSNPDRARGNYYFRKHGLNLTEYAKSEWETHRQLHPGTIAPKAYKRVASATYYRLLGVKK